MGVSLLVAMLSGGAAIVLLHSAVWKMAHPRVFRQIIQSHGTLVARLARLLAIGVPAVEFGIGAGLLASLAVATVHFVAHLALASAGLAFAAYGVRQLSTGRAVRCGCMGADDMFGADTVLRSALLTAIGIAGALDGPLAPPRVDSGQAWIIVGGGAALVAAVLLVGLKPLARTPVSAR
ncbi:MauE/DoxX family redox-associated membrane protein [Micromonospora deserti]|uniref:Methylamine utilisation protein MauE domain-containing protein n=1 Tax=Micromonospora deserti TaxID=2070366 RepID=A0A2W2CWB7_9ACTN|nr:MauE/DoxX family redox-associated membrane protein [Micromonospora deserti]PZG02221.1 hypothetical protein C1I99_03715 [Micromonospora deserti]